MTLTDSGGTVYKTASLTGTRYLVDFLNTGDGVAIGKPAEPKFKNYFDVGYRSRFRDMINVDNNKAIYGKTTDDVSLSMIYVNDNNNTVVGYGGYDNNIGSTNIYGYDINLGVGNIATPGSYRPYRRRGDTISIVMRTAGYVTNSGKDVSFWIPCSEPVVGSPTATAASNLGFVLRQGAKYTHGSSAEVYIHPTSYEVVATAVSGIYIKAVFDDTTNVTNNDAIGVYWSGIITLS